MIAIVAIILLGALGAILLRENRRLTNLLLVKNPSVAIAMEQKPKPNKKERQNPDVRVAPQNPVEAVGP